MNTVQGLTETPPVTRRRFLRKTSAGVAGGAFLGSAPVERLVHAASSDAPLKLALIGCGGRGTGAAVQALKTPGKVTLVTLADAFPDQLDNSLKNIRGQLQTDPDSIQVTPETLFSGLDAYGKAMALADVVILAAPPGFRPAHFEEAVSQGKHVFMEKPVATDAPGVRRVLDAARKARENKLKVGAGLQRRHQPGYIETVSRLHAGLIGKTATMRTYWNGNSPQARPRTLLEKYTGRPLTEMEYQVRNWYFFNWLSGDHITEQHIHNLDVINWIKQGHPVRAHGMGGRQVRRPVFRTSEKNLSIDPDTLDFGDVFDHHCVEFEYADGSRLSSQCRQINGCWNQVSEHVLGTKGACQVNEFRITGESAWRFRGRHADPYQRELDKLFQAIRRDEEFNEAEFGAHSTMTAILGRMCSYSGQALTWEEALHSKTSLAPRELHWEAPPQSLPDAHGLYPVAVPGRSTVL